ncbi:MAG: helix-turn-helix domain-containing protein [Stellaceae bacterium]
MKVTKGGSNVFSDIGLDEIEAEELAVKADLVTLLLHAVRARALTQTHAARICGVDQPTLSKILSGKLDSVTIDRLAKWIVALGGKIQITVKQPKEKHGKYKGGISVAATP